VNVPCAPSGEGSHKFGFLFFVRRFVTFSYVSRVLCKSAASAVRIHALSWRIEIEAHNIKTLSIASTVYFYLKNKIGTKNNQCFCIPCVPSASCRPSMLVNAWKTQSIPQAGDKVMPATPPMRSAMPAGRALAWRISPKSSARPRDCAPVGDGWPLCIMDLLVTLKIVVLALLWSAQKRTEIGHTAQMAERALRARPVFASVPRTTAEDKVAVRAIPFPEDAVEVCMDVVDGSIHLRLSLLEMNAMIGVPRQPRCVQGLSQCIRILPKAVWQRHALVRQMQIDIAHEHSGGRPDIAVVHLVRINVRIEHAAARQPLTFGANRLRELLLAAAPPPVASASLGKITEERICLIIVFHQVQKAWRHSV
jgi:hypothetical protein